MSLVEKPSPIWALYLYCEFLLIFIGSPILVVTGYLPKRPILVLILVSCLMFGFLLKDPSFHRRRLFHAKALKSHLKPVLMQFTILASLISAAVYILLPDHLFDLIKNTPLLWVSIIVAYPLLSVYPQEVIYRAFLFHRYVPVFPGEFQIVLASSLAFGFVHIVFGSWLSVALSFVGGLLFSSTYLKSRSLLLVTIEHSLIGIFLFTIGLGRYFYLK